jgi:replication factor C subunit 3/5
VLAPIRSRCLCIRIPSPSKEEIVSVLEKTAKIENINLPKQFSEKIAERSEGNLRKALLMLESSKVEQYPFKADQQVKVPDWEKFVADIAKDIMEEQSPKKLLEIREKYYLLITNCIPPEVIIQKLANQLISVLDYDLKHQVAHWAAHHVRCYFT